MKIYSVKVEGVQFLSADLDIAAASPEEAAAEAVRQAERDGADWEFTSKAGVPVEETIQALFVISPDGEEWEPRAIPAKVQVWTVVTTCPGEAEPCLPSVFGTDAAAEAYTETMMRAEWANNGPEDEETGERLPYPEGKDWREVQEIMETTDGDPLWGLWEIHSEEIELPAPHGAAEPKPDQAALWAIIEALQRPALAHLADLKSGVEDGTYDNDADNRATIVSMTAAFQEIAKLKDEFPEFDGAGGVVAAVILPEPNDGLIEYTVERAFDAHQLYHKTVRAESPDDALSRAESEDAVYGKWEDAGVTVYDHFEQSVKDADGNELLRG